MEQTVIIDTDGTVKSLYDDGLQVPGYKTCDRASNVVWNPEKQCWEVIPTGPFEHLPRLDGFLLRDEAIKAEIEMLNSELWEKPEILQHVGIGNPIAEIEVPDKIINDWDQITLYQCLSLIKAGELRDAEMNRTEPSVVFEIFTPEAGEWLRNVTKQQ